MCFSNDRDAFSCLTVTTDECAILPAGGLGIQEHNMPKLGAAYVIKLGSS